MCAGCLRNIRGGRVIEIQPAKNAGQPQKFHADCFGCSSCRVSLQGKAFKPAPHDNDHVEDRQTDGSLKVTSPGKVKLSHGNPSRSSTYVCESCWNAMYAPVCIYCQKRITENKYAVLNGLNVHCDCVKAEKEKRLTKFL